MSASVGGRRALLTFLAVAALALTGCGASAGTPAGAGGDTPGATESATGGSDGGSAPASTAEPASTQAAQTPDGTATPIDPAGTPGGGTTGPTPTGPAAACSGSDANRDFFVSAAHAVGWDVYCAVLPDGWFVQSGSYRLSSGGVLRVAYTGPNGARLELHEGGMCVADASCVPSGSDGGSASFGDRTGTFRTLDGGGFAIAVDGGQPVSWIAIGANMDQATFRGVAARLVPVPGNHASG